ncbi:hypothetical protein LTS18_006953 [Coniosporium uncinatum]|uniref:Uncharacterized protein n=1 Tax=Coniosporium uncinatum TaxID=93489 RepID=A0ACC3DQ12_9PEZI|nr:hypothetical protein LTS18_006953 [Coniosporium uncinatum]
MTLLFEGAEANSTSVELEMSAITTPLDELARIGDGLTKTASVDSTTEPTGDELKAVTLPLLVAESGEPSTNELNDATVPTLLRELELAVRFANGGATVGALRGELAETTASLLAAVENKSEAAALDASADPTLIGELELGDETTTGPGAVGRITRVLDVMLVRDTSLLFAGAEDASMPAEFDVGTGWMLVAGADEVTITVTGIVVVATEAPGDELVAETSLLPTAGSNKRIAVED